MKKLNRSYCNKLDDCWNYNYMVKEKFSVEEMYKVCRKCKYANFQKGGIVSKETLDEVFKKCNTEI